MVHIGARAVYSIETVTALSAVVTLVVLGGLADWKKRRNGVALVLRGALGSGPDAPAGSIINPAIIASWILGLGCKRPLTAALFFG